jgi:hypothetical protein
VPVYKKPDRWLRLLVWCLYVQVLKIGSHRREWSVTVTNLCLKNPVWEKIKNLEPEGRCVYDTLSFLYFVAGTFWTCLLVSIPWYEIIPRTGNELRITPDPWWITIVCSQPHGHTLVPRTTVNWLAGRMCNRNAVH